ncbi:MAG TPA: ATP-binding protein, partial [Chitinophagaceae bacterium]|nr:ATP-binding protein [Chitinophagaceae bacterium]
TMAMQKSDELPETSYLLFQQVKELGLTAAQNSIAIINEETGFVELSTTVHGHHLPHTLNVPINDPYVMAKAVAAWKAKHKSLKVEIRGQELKDYNERRNSFFETKVDFPEDQWIVNIIFFSKGWLSFSSNKDISGETFELLKRFAAVFEQTYIRFNDLKQAEAQARESQIEAALERVRSRSMGMQKSEELKEVIQVVFEQFVHLNIHVEHTGFVMDYKARDDYNIWVADPLGVPSQLIIPYFDSVYYNRFNEAKEKGEDFFATNLSFEEKNRFYKKLFEFVPGLTEEAKEFYFNCPGLAASTVLLDNVGLYIENFSGIPYTDEENNTLMRFGKVFQQTYTRFLDLQKAEAQAREAKIEAALEKVRGRAMAMHKSNELLEACAILYNELFKLGISCLTSGYVLMDEEEKIGWNYVINPADGTILPRPVGIPHTETEVMQSITKSWKKQEPFHVRELDPQATIKHHRYLAENSIDFPISVEEFLSVTPERLVFYTFNFKQGYLLITGGEQLTTDQVEMVIRFAKVFEMTYRRFLDLQKAEAQAREAQIEAALERVRSRSLAMHTASELGEVVTVIVDKLRELGVVLDANGVVLCTYFQNSKDVMHWIVSPDYSMAGHYLLPYFDHPIFNAAWESRENGDEYFSKAFSVAEKNSFFEHAFAHSDYRHFPDEFKQWIFQNDQHILSFAWQKNSAILIPSHTGVLPSEEDIAILKRFSKVFEQSYVRFLDLQKAEAQAREAKIENALEKVRSRTMAMQRSDELQGAAFLLFQQVQALGARYFACGFNIWDDDKKEATAWMAREQGFQPPFKTSSSEDVFFHIHEAAQRGESLFVAQQGGQELETHYKYMASIPVFKSITDKMAEAGLSVPSFQIIHCAFFSQGYLMFISFEPVPEAHDIFKRFAKVFEQTYTRFLDLKKAEAQAKEAQIEAALERVRSRTMAMQKSEELSDAAYVLFQQLNLLGVVHERINIGIVNEENNVIDFWITEQGGNEIRTRFTGSISEPTTISKIYACWKEGKRSGVVELLGEDLSGWLNYLHEIGIPFDPAFRHNRRVQTTANFSNGMLVVTSPEPLQEEAIYLLERFAGVFDLTYTRFNDLKVAEAHTEQARLDLIQIQTEKQRAEETLAELQATQKQLIQAEKMASLGELTAGIAHEIQNPLNFVNNFSDVNKELLEEMKDEIEKGNIGEVKAIANDIIGNEEKINHHGKRADAIVKGMLQHSKSSTGVKEPTDINVLADEYFRLAYHGLRAKDKSFNASMKTDFDDTIGKVNIVPQDIGRAVLNLITNAFYAVSEKKKSSFAEASEDKYEPTVTVITKRINGKVEIRVADNGNGIPQKVLDKIFQPFFTTKPTGQGTGLGLSLSYDIVKAHNGELKVETNEGEGSEFIIFLPANN